MAGSENRSDPEHLITEHLETIDRALAARGMPLTERRSVTGDVEAQIRDMLEERAGDEPTTADVEAVLGMLDAAESYVEDGQAATDESTPTTGVRPSRLSRVAVVGAAWAPFTFVMLLLWLVAVPVTGPHGSPAPGPAWWQIAALVVLLPLGSLAPFATTILGWIAVGQIRRSAGRLHGLGLALADGLLFPLLLLDILVYMFWRVVIAVAVAWKTLGIAALGRPHYASVDRNPMVVVVLAAITSVVVDWLIVRWAWRKVARNEGER